MVCLVCVCLCLAALVQSAVSDRVSPILYRQNAPDYGFSVSSTFISSFLYPDLYTLACVCRGVPYHGPVGVCPCAQYDYASYSLTPGQSYFVNMDMEVEKSVAFSSYTECSPRRCVLGCLPVEELVPTNGIFRGTIDSKNTASMQFWFNFSFVPTGHVRSLTLSLSLDQAINGRLYLIYGTYFISTPFPGDVKAVPIANGTASIQLDYPVSGPDATNYFGTIILDRGDLISYTARLRYTLFDPMVTQVGDSDPVTVSVDEQVLQMHLGGNKLHILSCLPADTLIGFAVRENALPLAQAEFSGNFSGNFSLGYIEKQNRTIFMTANTYGGQVSCKILHLEPNIYAPIPYIVWALVMVVMVAVPCAVVAGVFFGISKYRRMQNRGAADSENERLTAQYDSDAADAADDDVM